MLLKYYPIVINNGRMTTVANNLESCISRNMTCIALTLVQSCRVQTRNYRLSHLLIVQRCLLIEALSLMDF